MLMGNDTGCPLGNKQPGALGCPEPVSPSSVLGDGEATALCRAPPHSLRVHVTVQPWGPLFPLPSSVSLPPRGTLLALGHSCSLPACFPPLFLEFSSRGSPALGSGEESRCDFDDPGQVFPYLLPFSFSQAQGVHSEGTAAEDEDTEALGREARSWSRCPSSPLPRSRGLPSALPGSTFGEGQLQRAPVFCVSWGPLQDSHSSDTYFFLSSLFYLFFY